MPDVTHPDASDSENSHDSGGKRLSNVKRFAIAGGICLVVIGVLAGLKFAQISALIRSGKAAQAAGPPPQAVGTDVAATGVWQSVFEAVGSVTAARGVTISNDSPGVVRSIRFDSGAQVRAGQVLVELDAAVERAQLASLKARLGLAATTAGRTRLLTEKGANTRLQLDTDEAQLKTTTADVAALEAQIERKIVRAPFAGKLGIRSVNLGQYLNPGTPITVLESTEAVVVDFTIPQQELARVPVGATTRIVLPGTQPAQTLEGKISAVEPDADPTTRAVKLRASVNDEKAQLRPGMFVNISVLLPERAKVVSVPATAIARAPYGDSVYVVETRKDEKGDPVSGRDGKPAKVARQQFVRVGQARGDFVAIMDGVTAGQEVVTQGAFKLRNGAPVMVNNGVKLSPSQTPRPENH
ncbi:MAG TPA: efflux RND transporter periplasmic adaptor subunit [Polyangia bacterium]|jgi:membrane fusion protein (multidrug efflux system)|nr:efflux RND transporter periplasmic adaptor subunit [Polyangia bacterium]